jgi:hypothetical protein
MDNHSRRVRFRDQTRKIRAETNSSKYDVLPTPHPNFNPCRKDRGGKIVAYASSRASSRMGSEEPARVSKQSDRSAAVSTVRTEELQSARSAGAWHMTAKANTIFKDEFRTTGRRQQSISSARVRKPRRSVADRLVHGNLETTRSGPTTRGEKPLRLPRQQYTPGPFS